MRLTVMFALLVLLITALTTYAPLQSPGSRSGAVAPVTSEHLGASDAALPADVRPEWWGQVRQSIQAEEYTASRVETGLQAPNRAQDLRTWFHDEGIEVTPRTRDAEAWRWRWSTESWGRRGHMLAAEPVPPMAQGSRVEYVRSGIVEWYENGPEGLEQGFTVSTRPTGSGRLRIEGRISGNLKPRPSGGDIDYVNESGSCPFRYGKLVVHDSRGTTLDSRMETGDGWLALEMDDRGAVYPLHVDPLMTSPAWTAESDQAGAGFGYSVATAGDVNGDGYSDVIVGSDLYDNGQTSEGRAYVFHGSATGLSTTAAWVAESNQALAFFGIWVAPAGDVNGDGYSDVIIGSPGYDNGHADEGRAWVYHGSSSGLGASAAWTTEANQVNAAYGNALGTAGDVNADGYSDVIVAAPRFDNGQIDEGRTFVYHGSSSGLSTTASWTAESNFGGAEFGNSVSTAGDVNGDGYSDVIVGYQLYSGGQTFEGAANVWHGSATGLATSFAWGVESNQAQALFGSSVATAGDVNGDGYSDVIIGSPRYDNPQDREGRAFVYHGSGSGLSTTAAWTAESDQASAEFGIRVATAGDINGDGFADVLVGTDRFDNGQTDEGRAYLYQGSSAGLATSAAWTAESNQAGANQHAVATAGDVNGDGFSDVIVGAWHFDNGQADEGRAFVYHGSASGLASTAGWTADGGQANAEQGFQVATAGDVNGDGFSDVIVGARQYDNGQTHEGRAYVFHGSATGPAATASWTVESNQSSSYFGTSVASAGDVNGDGYSDVIVGAFGFDNGQNDEGRAFVYHGSSTGLSTTAAATRESDQVGARFGTVVAGAGDVNGDGYSDVIVGAYLFDNGQTDEGRVYVYHGSSGGIGATAVWTAESDQTSASMGFVAATAGDVNRDGYSDVITSAFTYDNGQTDEGRAYVYHGSASGLGSTPAWTNEINQTSAIYGNSVGTAGDVNADGYSDVIIGAPYFDNGQTNEGRTYVYHGSATGLATSEAWSTESNQVDALYGYSSASAGDVNGDGYSDVIVGAHLFDNGQVNEGRAFVYQGSSTGLSTTAAWTAESDLTGAQYGWSAASAGDVNGDGFSDVIAGARLYSNGGRAQVFYGNGGDGLHRIPRQRRADDSAPVDVLGGTGTDFRLRGLGRSPGGRARVGMEWEVKPLGSAFNGVTTKGSFVDTGTPVGGVGSAASFNELVTGLSTGPHHWRFRTLTNSPFFPRSAWMSLPYNNPTETDLRALSQQVVQGPFGSGSGTGTQISYNLTITGAGNRIVLVYVVTNGWSPTSVTFNGNACTLQGSAINDAIIPGFGDTGCFGYFYSIQEASLPGAGTYSVVVNFSSSTNAASIASMASGVNQSAPFGEGVSNTAGPLASSISSEVNDCVANGLVIDMVVADAAFTPSWNPTSPQTSRGSVLLSDGETRLAISDVPSSTGSVTMAGSGSSNMGIAQFAVELKPVGGGGGGGFRAQRVEGLGSFALEGVRPNPTQAGRMQVHFILPDHKPAELELFDLLGRRVARAAVGSLGPGRHSVDLAKGRTIEPGVYFIRLTRGDLTSIRRTTVLR